MYLGGNGINCEVTMHDGSDGVIHSEAVYHNGISSRMAFERGPNGEPPPSGGWESRFHLRVGESEASLLGVVYTEEGVMTAAPYAVCEGAEDHWVYAGTGLKAGNIFGEESLSERIPGGMLGG